MLDSCSEFVADFIYVVQIVQEMDSLNLASLAQGKSQHHQSCAGHCELHSYYLQPGRSWGIFIGNMQGEHRPKQDFDVSVCLYLLLEDVKRIIFIMDMYTKCMAFL